MRKIILTTESCADIPKEIREQQQIDSIPFGISFPERNVLDGEIEVSEIYDFYQRTKQIPKTSAINPYEYTEFFENITRANLDCEIIHIGYSSACSCAHQNAVLGIQECTHAKVHLIDSLNVSGGFGNIVLKAADIIKRNSGDTASKLVDRIKPYIKKTKTSFVPDTLEFLSAGGRVSNAAALGASILHLKPRIDIIEGKLIAAKKYRGRMEKIISEFVDDFVKNSNFDKQVIYAVYAEGTEERILKKFRESILSHGFREIQLWKIGCVMTVHGGKGAIGLSATEV